MRARAAYRAARAAPSGPPSAPTSTGTTCTGASPRPRSSAAVSGPIARASGLDVDLRRDDPYLAYAELGVTVVLGSAGDAHTRVKDPVITVREDGYEMWLCCHPLDEPGHEDRMTTRRLTSADGLDWTDHGEVLAGGTMAAVCGGGTLEERFVGLAGGHVDSEGLEWLGTFSG